MQWIINHKRYAPGYFLGSIFVFAIGLTLTGISGLFLWISLHARQTNWYHQSVLAESRSDIFSGDRTNSVFFAVEVMIALVMVFVIISLCTFRRLQLEKMKTEIWIYVISGYSFGRVNAMLLADALIDILIAVPFAFAAWIKLLDIMRNREEFRIMLSAVNLNGTLCAGLFAISVISSCMIIFFCDRIVRR
jgi:hypothetical protein